MVAQSVEAEAAEGVGADDGGIGVVQPAFGAVARRGHGNVPLERRSVGMRGPNARVQRVGTPEEERFTTLAAERDEFDARGEAGERLVWEHRGELHRPPARRPRRDGHREGVGREVGGIEGPPTGHAAGGIGESVRRAVRLKPGKAILLPNLAREIHRREIVAGVGRALGIDLEAEKRSARGEGETVAADSKGQIDDPFARRKKRGVVGREIGVGRLLQGFAREEESLRVRKATLGPFA